MRVEVGECRCAGTPHPDGDWVDLYPSCTIAIGAAVHMAVSLYGDDPMALQVALSRAFVGYGIREWSFVNAKGDPIIVNHNDPSWHQTVEDLLPFSAGGLDVANVADGIYAKAALDPLVRQMATSSLHGPTTGSTSASRSTGSTPRKHSKRSSPTSSAGGRRSAVQGG